MAEQTIKIRVQDSRKVGEDIRVVETETSVSLNVTEEAVIAIAETMSNIVAKFPMPVVEDASLTWYNDAFVARWVAASTGTIEGVYMRLFDFLGKLAPDIGNLTLNTKKHPSTTIAQCETEDPRYLDWLEGQSDDWRLRVAIMRFRGHDLREKKEKEIN